MVKLHVALNHRLERCVKHGKEAGVREGERLTALERSPRQMISVSRSGYLCGRGYQPSFPLLVNGLSSADNSICLCRPDRPDLYPSGRRYYLYTGCSFYPIQQQKVSASFFIVEGTLVRRQFRSIDRSSILRGRHGYLLLMGCRV